MKALEKFRQFVTSQSGLRTALVLAIGFQLSVLGTQLVSAAYPHVAGTTVKVATVPVDPRSLFRGHYARLSYDFSRLTAKQIGINDETFKAQRIGEPVYVTLKLDNNGLHAFNSASLVQPEHLATGEIVLLGRFASRAFSMTAARPIDFGIDAYFAPQERSLALEHDLRHGGVATLKVTRHGRAALVDVTGKPEDS